MLTFEEQFQSAAKTHTDGISYPEMRKLLTARWGIHAFDTRANFSVQGTTDYGAQVSVSWPQGNVWTATCNGLTAFLNKEHLVILPQDDYGWTPRLLEILSRNFGPIICTRLNKQTHAESAHYLALFFEGPEGFLKAISMYEQASEWQEESFYAKDLLTALSEMSLPYMLSDPPNPSMKNEFTLQFLIPT